MWTWNHGVITFSAPRVINAASHALSRSTAGGASMSLTEIIGFVAGFGTTFAAVPDLLKMFKRQSSQGMNPTMAAIMGTFQIVWVYYGFLIDSRPVIAWNVVAVGINFLTVGAYFYFASHEKKRD